MNHLVFNAYASALFDTARNNKKLLSDVFKQAKMLLTLCQDDSALMAFLKNQHLDLPTKTTALKEVLGKQCDKLIINWLQVILSSHQIRYLPNILKRFLTICDGYYGNIYVKAITTKPLSNVARNQLISALKTKFDTKAENIVINNIIDPNILGGIKLQVDDYCIDHSYSYQLQLIQDLIKQEFNSWSNPTIANKKVI